MGNYLHFLKNVPKRKNEELGRNPLSFTKRFPHSTF